MTTRRAAKRVAEIAYAPASDPGSAVLMDTHVWVGYLDSTRFALPPALVERLAAAQHAGGLLVPEVAIWEIGIKSGRGSMKHAPPVRDWVERATGLPGTRTIPFSAEIMLRSVELPGEAPRDPMDRAIIATAMVHGVPLATLDRAIHRWAQETRAIQCVDD